MSPRSPTEPAGFTLLETMVGLLALSLLAMGLSRLVVSHERLMASMEDWLAGDPVWYVARDEDPLARVLGAPATLSETLPAATLPDPPPGRVDVTVLSIDHGLRPHTASAMTQLVDNCYYGADLASVGALLDSVWDVTGDPGEVSVTTGTLAFGVFAGAPSGPRDTVDIDVGGHSIAAGDYHMRTNLAALQQVRIRLSGGQNGWVDGILLGATGAGDLVWSFTVSTAADLEQIEVSAQSVAAELELSLYEECITDDIL